MRKALLVIDVQNDFCEGGALAVAGGNAVAEKVKRFIESTDAYYSILGTADWHIDPGKHWSDAPDYVDSWPKHCEAGTMGAEYHPALFHTLKTVFKKGQYTAAYSGFEGFSDEYFYDLSAYLTLAHITHVDVVGLALDYCVAATAKDAAERGYVTRVLLDGTAAVHSDPASIMRTVRDLEEAGVECV